MSRIELYVVSSLPGEKKSGKPQVQGPTSREEIEFFTIIDQLKVGLRIGNLLHQTWVSFYFLIQHTYDHHA